MLNKLASIGLATSIAFAPMVLAPMAARADDAPASATKIKRHASKPAKAAKSAKSAAKTK
jgi:hypothetical protein